MGFSERLNSLIGDVEGSFGAALVGIDGVAIESSSQGIDMVNVGAEYSAILGDAQKASQDLNLGEIRTISILTDQMNLVFSLLKSEYFLALSVKNRGNWGEARHKLRGHAPRFEEEM